MPKLICNHQAALNAIEKVLALLRSIPTLEIAVESLRK
jgi:hypothetical protein